MSRIRLNRDASTGVKYHGELFELRTRESRPREVLPRMRSELLAGVLEVRNGASRWGEVLPGVRDAGCRAGSRRCAEFVKPQEGSMFKLYGFTPTRSARVKWALQEVGAKFEYIEAASLFGTDELKQLHPLGKIPVFVHDEKVLFESVAIVNYICDLHPDADLIAATGTVERALHDQWSCFAIAELETWNWIMAKHTNLLPAEQRVPALIPWSMEEMGKSVAVVEQALQGLDYLVGNEFSATDINIGYVLNQARARGLVAPAGNIDRYLNRIGDRPASTIPEQKAFEEAIRKSKQA